MLDMELSVTARPADLWAERESSEPYDYREALMRDACERQLDLDRERMVTNGLFERVVSSTY